MTPLLEPLRLLPGDDLREALAQHQPAFVLAGIGSLCPAVLRLAGAEQLLQIDEDCELLTLSGSLSADGPHLHASLALRDGRVLGGHVASGCLVRTTAELLLVHLPGWELTRRPDPATGYAELCIARRDCAAGEIATADAKAPVPLRSPAGQNAPP